MVAGTKDNSEVKKARALKPSAQQPESGTAAQRRPRVGITGSFGRGNYGDELYIKTYQHFFGKWADLFLLTGLPRPSYLKDFGNAFVDMMDAVVLGGGDLLCPYRTQIDRDFVNPMYLRRPVHVAGIGVERNRPDVEPDVVTRWSKFLTDPNIRSVTTRDPGSAEWISEHIAPSLSVGSHPDLVCALPLPPASVPEGPRILGLVTRHIKHPKEYKLMQEIAADMMAKGWRVRHIIGGVGSHGVKDFENSKHLEAEGKETFYTEDLDDISRAIGECSLVLSMKLHTTLVSVMYGVPTICVNPVVKARAFMSAAGCDDLVFASNDRKIIDRIAAGVAPPPKDNIRKLRNDTSEYLCELSQSIWDDFRAADPARKSLPEKPALPSW